MTTVVSDLPFAAVLLSSTAHVFMHYTLHGVEMTVINESDHLWGGFLGEGRNQRRMM